MQKLAEICIRRPVFAAMIILSLVVVGAASYFKLGVDRFPSIDLPTVTVRMSLPGASPEEAESSSHGQSKTSSIRSKASNSFVRSRARDEPLSIATFNLDRDIETAAQDVRDRVQGVLRMLPPGTDPPVVQKQDSDT